MSYVLVAADFPSITSTQRTLIYDCLKEKNWIKVTEPGRDIDTVWYGFFSSTITEPNAIQTAISNFVDCSKQFCRVKLVVHFGPNKPTFYGLD